MSLGAAPATPTPITPNPPRARTRSAVVPKGYADQPGIATRPAPIDVLAPTRKAPTRAKASRKAKADAGLTPAQVAAGKKERKRATAIKAAAIRKRNAVAKAA